MITENWRDEVLKLADDYCAASGIKRTVLSARIASDADFLDHIANKGGCTVDKLQKIMSWLQDNAPLISKPNGHRKRNT